jgi:hypothetical protein
VVSASDNSEYLDKTFWVTSANVCSENTLFGDNSNILAIYQKLSTEVPLKSKPKTKLPPQSKRSVFLNIYHKTHEA